MLDYLQCWEWVKKKLLQCWEWIKKKLRVLDNERLAIGAVAFIGVLLLIPVLLFTPELIESFNVASLFEVFAEYGSFIAGGAYLGRLVNIITSCLIDEEPDAPLKTRVTTLFSHVTVGRPILTCEKTLTPIGMLLGISLAVACIVGHCAMPYWNVFSYFSYVLFTLGAACTVGGLFNRVGSAYDGTRLRQEKKTILFGSLLGVLLTVILIAVLLSTGTLPFIAVAGITKVFFSLFAIHKTLFILMGGVTLISLTTSCCDYWSKSYCFLKYCFKFGASDKQLNDRLSTRYHEYRGAFLGGMMACCLIMAIGATLFFSGAFIGVSLFAVGVTLLLTVITCMSVVPSLFSRIGRVIDGVKRTSMIAESSSEQNITSVNENELEKGGVEQIIETKLEQKKIERNDAALLNSSLPSNPMVLFKTRRFSLDTNSLSHASIDKKQVSPPSLMRSQSYASFFNTTQDLQPNTFSESAAFIRR